MARENEALAAAIKQYRKALEARASLRELLDLGKPALVSEAEVRADYQKSRECPPVRTEAAMGGQRIQS